MKNKILPVGYDDFSKIRAQGFYYVDKTEFIGKLIRSRGMVNLFTRPRRFGKSLIMSMLKAFFEIGADPSLFNGLAIEKDREICEEYQGKYPVLSITLKGIEAEDYENTLENLRDLISSECKRLSFLRDSERVDDDDREIFKLLWSRKSGEVELRNSLKTLMRMLHDHYGKEVILLIDEYDVPLDKSYNKGYYDRMIGFMRAFFGEAFKTNSDLEFAVVTGCLRISKESIFTGINNLKIDSISNSRFDEYFGFTDKDVKQILKDYDLCDKYEQIREWYDGYRFGEVDVYCPWDVMYYCDELLALPDAEPQLYWTNTSSNNFIKMFIDQADQQTREDIERLIDGEVIERKLTENLTYAEIGESIENLWSVLYITGYLTKDKAQKSQKRGYVRLVIPNREIKYIFVEKIHKWFEEKVKSSAQELNEMYHAIITGDAETFENIVASQLAYTISYYDRKEDFYHGFLLGLLVGNREWNLKSNREMGLGRSDITLASQTNKFGVVIEIKRTDNVMEMDVKSEEALRQIEEKRYAEEFIKFKNTVWAYGIAFAEKNCHVIAKKLK